ncbi:MAG: restriction endonuclease subunit S [Pseudomonadota bacterium]
MKLETFFEKFEQFAEAPNAVKKLRGLVLEWGATGKLCHNQSVEWKEGVLGDVIELISGQHLLANEHNFEGRGIPYLTGPSDFGEKHPIPTRWSDQPKVTAQPGDILITVKGSGVGKTNVLVDQPTAISRQLMAIRVTGADPEFVYVVVKRAAEHFQNSKTGIAIPGIGRKEVLGLKVVLPPLAEQKRIVAKVDGLMALCDRLEAQQQERDTRHAALASAALARFADAPTPANQDFLFHTSYAIAPADLRKTILTLAVQGKLVPQDPNDELAVNMLVKIEAEKKRLSDCGELKADKKAWVGASFNPPHDIPETWCWTRLQDVFEISRGGSPRPAGDSRYFGGSIPWITVGEITKDSTKYLTETATGLTEEGAKRSRFINSWDLLLTNSGATLGVPKISKIRGCMNDGVAVLRLFHSFDLNDFAYLYLVHQTPAFRSVNQGMGQPNLNTPIIAGWFFPLPPIAEQRRIVAKVDQLMALVDLLETQLADSRAAAINLMEAVVAELTLQGVKHADS